jgi:hypothetical protein
MRDSGGPSKMVQRDRPHLRRCSNYPDGFDAPYPRWLLGTALSMIEILRSG